MHPPIIKSTLFVDYLRNLARFYFFLACKLAAVCMAGNVYNILLTISPEGGGKKKKQKKQKIASSYPDNILQKEKEKLKIIIRGVLEKINQKIDSKQEKNVIDVGVKGSDFLLVEE